MKWTFSLLPLVSLILFSLNAHSEVERRFLPGCTEVGHVFQDGRLALKPLFKTSENQGIFFLHNRSEIELTIKLAPTKTTNLYPAWERTLEADHWAAFATNKQNINFSCFHKDNLDANVEIDCKEALEICQYVHAEFGRQNQGNYWVSENLSKIETRDHVIHNGILLRW